MDPMQLMMMQQYMQQRNGGMFGGQPGMQQQPQGLPQMGGPLTQQQQGQQQGHHGMNPLMFLSPLAAMFMSGHPNIGLGMISPALGAARGLGLFK